MLKLPVEEIQNILVKKNDDWLIKFKFTISPRYRFCNIKTQFTIVQKYFVYHCCREIMTNSSDSVCVMFFMNSTIFQSAMLVLFACTAEAVLGNGRFKYIKRPVSKYPHKEDDAAEQRVEEENGVPSADGAEGGDAPPPESPPGGEEPPADSQPPPDAQPSPEGEMPTPEQQPSQEDPSQVPPQENVIMSTNASALKVK